MITLSILIPVYNVERYIRRCLDSVYKQLPNNCEVIIVDDGSSDNSTKICDEYQIVNPHNTKVIHKKNSGAYSSRNVAMNNAQGEYFWLIDPDDFITENAISDILSTIEAKHPDIISLAYKRCNENSFFDLTNAHDNTIVSGEEYILNYSPDPYLWSKVYNASFLQKNNLKFNEDVYSQGDWLFNMYAFSCASTIVLTPFYCYNYFDNPYSTLRTTDQEKVRCNLNNSLVIIKEFSDFISMQKDVEIKARLKDWQGYNTSGFLYALLLNSFSQNEIKEFLSKLECAEAYPAPKTTHRKAQLFLNFANIKWLFLLMCRLYRLIKHR